jgi:hypothetical protein
LLGSFGSIFGGFKAEGGPVSPGTGYVIGESGAERFVPTTPGYIVPNGAAMAKQSQPLVVQAHFHGVQNADSFRASQDHVLNHLANAVTRAVGRR